MLDLNLIRSMRNGTIQNYATPGLNSSLIGGEGSGKVRLFESSRDQQQEITPHSHRFDFQCLVLCGTVINRLWVEGRTEEGDFFQETLLNYGGTPGHYERKAIGPGWYERFDTQYSRGQVYSMRAEQIHSILFSRGAAVLFFEGPPRLDSSVILEPIVNDIIIPTFKVEEWMFQKD